MAIKRVEESWKNFPYGKNFAEGASNNGGFNLVENPDQIELITEFEKLPKIKNAVIDLNSMTTPFMTTGFLFDRKDEDSVYFGYIEFCFRPNINYSPIDVELLDEMFVAYSLEVMGRDFAEFYEKEFIWEFRLGTIQQSIPVPIYNVYFRARSHEEAELELIPLLEWLESSFQHLIK